MVGGAAHYVGGDIESHREHKTPVVIGVFADEIGSSGRAIGAIRLRGSRVSQPPYQCPVLLSRHNPRSSSSFRLSLQLFAYAHTPCDALEPRTGRHLGVLAGEGPAHDRRAPAAALRFGKGTNGGLGRASQDRGAGRMAGAVRGLTDVLGGRVVRAPPGRSRVVARTSLAPSIRRRRLLLHRVDQRPGGWAPRGRISALRPRRRTPGRVRRGQHCHAVRARCRPWRRRSYPVRRDPAWQAELVRAHWRSVAKRVARGLRFAVCISHRDRRGRALIARPRVDHAERIRRGRRRGHL